MENWQIIELLQSGRALRSSTPTISQIEGSHQAPAKAYIHLLYWDNGFLQLNPFPNNQDSVFAASWLQLLSPHLQAVRIY